MPKKKYAPLVKQEKIDVRKKLEHFVWYRSLQYKNGEYGVRCPHCGKTFVWNENDHKPEPQEEPARFELFSFDDIPFDESEPCPPTSGNADYVCPHCGMALEFLDLRITTKDHLEPLTETIFTMEDGSKAISIVSAMPCVFKMANGEYGFRTTYVRERVIFSSNGHTYYRPPVNVNTGKRVMRDIWKSKIYDITYHPKTFSFSLVSAFDKVEAVYKNLGKNADRNRFRRLSEGFIREVSLSFDSAGLRKYALHRAIGLEDDDAAALKHMTERFHLPKGKKFRKWMVRFPMAIAGAWLDYKKLGMDDINIFYNALDSLENVAKKFGDNDLELRLLQVVRQTTTQEEWLAEANKIAKDIDENTERRIYQMILGHFHIVSNKPREIRKHFTKEAVGYLLVYKNLNVFNDIKHMVRDIGTDEETVRAIIHQCFKKDNIMKTHENVRRLYQQVRRERKMQGVAPMVFNALKSNDDRAIVKAYCEVAQNADVAIEYEDEVKKYEQKVDGISFVLPKRTEELEGAGFALHNCVDSYRVNVLTRQDTIVFMEEDSKLVGCIEVMPDKSIRQAFGPCNTQLYGDEKKAFDKWCKALGLGEKEYYGAAVHEEVCFNPKMVEMLKQFEREHPEEKEAWLKENESIAKIIAA